MSLQVFSIGVDKRLKRQTGINPSPGETKMADLRNGETSVDVTRNESRMGDSGRRKRSENSAYLLAGGSRDTYSVTVNFETGHFCKVDGGANCKGNMHGKGQKFGPINARDTRNSNEWCKHVSAVLANVEQVAEAQEITAQAFGKKTATVTIKPPVPAFEEPTTAEGDARARLATLEAEAAALRESIASDERIDRLRMTVAALIGEHTVAEIAEALKYASN
jgi:hypothetical protein